MPNEPKKNLSYEDRHTIGRNNTKDQSVDFTISIIDWVRQRESEIKKRNKDIKNVTKQIIITKTF